MAQEARGRKKILMIAEPAGGGVRRHVVDLLGALDTQRFSVTLLYGVSRMDQAFRDALPELETRAVLIGVKSLCRELSFGRDIAAFCRIYSQVRQERPDVVHCHSSKAGALGRVAARLLGVPVIFYTPHCYAFQTPEVGKGKGSFYRYLERVLSRCCTTRTLNVSEGERGVALAAKLDIPQKFMVIANGLPPLQHPARAAARRMLQVENDTLLVGTAARTETQKAPELFVEIARRVCAAQQQVRFVYLGDGPLLEPMRKMVFNIGLEQKVRFPGYCVDAAVLTEGFDLFLSTSHSEGLPYGLLEAARAGVPCVATDVTGNQDVVREGVNGFLFPRGDAEAGAAQVCRALRERPFLPDEIRKDFTARFSLQRMVAQIEAQYTAGKGF